MQRAISRQRGVFTIITAVGALLLVLILGFVVDGSRLMVVQGELQNATDACALAAAAELNGQSGATFRAAAAGSQVGGAMNKKNFQGTSVAIVPGDVKFSTSLNGTYVAASGSSLNFRFAQCTAKHSGWINLFMGLVGLGTDEPVASSKAGLQQTTKVCVLPAALQTINATGPNFGYVPITSTSPPPTTSAVILSNLRVADQEAQILSKTASEYAQLIADSGTCNVSTDMNRVIGFDGSNTMSGSLNSALLARYSNDPTFATAAGTSNRRLMAVPFVGNAISTSATVRGWACLELRSNPVTSLLEVVYHGQATATSSSLPSSPCVVTGIPGYGAVGPFAPVLVK
ncbi:MAG: TadE/TadG family type IV pilus assembly protein [Limnohabitans sp.]